MLRLYVSVPVACFRVSQAREYWETYPCPPPSTVYGMLLSLVGEPDRLVHQGAELAIGLLSEPQRSVVLRTLWRVKDSKAGPGIGNNKRPDFQELLSDIRLSVWVRRGEKEKAEPSLFSRLSDAFNNPGNITRFGGLSLGESTHLVDEARPWRSNDPQNLRLLIPDDKGDLSLPVWPDHVGSKGTAWRQFKLGQEALVSEGIVKSAWVPIITAVDSP